jgi:hypothetical protein
MKVFRDINGGIGFLVSAIGGGFDRIYLLGDAPDAFSDATDHSGHQLVGLDASTGPEGDQVVVGEQPGSHTVQDGIIEYPPLHQVLDLGL